MDKKTLGVIGLDGRRLAIVHVLPKYYRIRIGTRLVDFVVALKRNEPLIVEVAAGTRALTFLEACGFKESEEDKKNREENGLKVVKLSRKK